ncbi:hypothetical protein [Streptomyces sp. NPDC088196]|uniref:hypothetical protein n=1 Tax=Streptomyces sp. NPDC088196 TaxID=3154868 RepID=UPI00344E63C5
MARHAPFPSARSTLLTAAGGAPVRSDGFANSLTWASVITAAGIAIGIYFTVVHRRRDKLAKMLEPTGLLLEDVAVTLDHLSTLTATRDDLPRLHELRSRVKQAEKRFTSIPLGNVVAAIGAYEEAVLPADFRTSSREVEQLLELSRQQGSMIKAAQFAVDDAQAVIANLLKR